MFNINYNFFFMRLGLGSSNYLRSNLSLGDSICGSKTPNRLPNDLSLHGSRGSYILK